MARSSLVGHEIAAVGIGADRQGLGLQIAQARRPRPCARSASKAALCWRETPRAERAAPPRCGRADFSASSSTTRLCSSSARLMRSTLSLGDDVGRHALLELGEPLVIAVLEGLEGAHEVVEGGARGLATSADLVSGAESLSMGGPLLGEMVSGEMVSGCVRPRSRQSSNGEQKISPSHDLTTHDFTVSARLEALGPDISLREIPG